MSDLDITTGEIEAAVEQAAPAGDTPRQQPQTTTDKPLASATDAPVVTEKPEDRFKGWIPPDAHKRIVDGFHSRLDEVSWARSLKRDEVEAALALQRQINERRSAPEVPQADVKDEQGNRFYSPEQAARWAAIEGKRIAEEIVNARFAEYEKRFGPIESAFSEHQRLSGYNQQIDAVAELPGAVDYIVEMTDYLRDINDRRAAGEPLPAATVFDAYLAVVPKRLQDKATVSEADIRKKVLKELNETTERVKDDVNPSRVPAASRKKDSEKSLKELLEEGAAEMASR